MKFSNFSSEHAIRKWISESYEECKASYPLPKRGRIAFDIGANVGGFCIHSHKNFDKIYAFEPLIENYNVAEQVLKKLKINNVDLFNTAVFSESGKVMKIYSNSDSHISGDVTLVSDGVIKEQHDSGQSCETISLKDAMISLGVDKIDYLKLDCEGSEYEILESFHDYDRIDWICMEIHGVYNDDRRMRLLNKLNQHYHIIDIKHRGVLTLEEMLKKTKPIEHYIDHANLLCINRNLK